MTLGNNINQILGLGVGRVLETQSNVCFRTSLCCSTLLHLYFQKNEQQSKQHEFGEFQ